MEDMIIKGTGNSRFLRTVPDALTLYPTWESAVRAMVAGTFPIDLPGINPDGVERMGMGLTKANLLSDKTAAALGGVETPNEALDALRSFVLSGKTVFRVAVKFDDGTPVAGIELNLSALSGQGKARTDSDGIAYGYSNSATTQISLKYAYFDLQCSSVTVTGVPGTLSFGALTVRKIDYRSFTSSTSGYFSPLCTRVDVSGVSGGGGGGAGGRFGNLAGNPDYGGTGGNGGGNGGIGGKSGTPSTYTEYPGPGGGGGGSGGGKVQENVSFSPDVSYPVVIGNGGAADTKGDENSAGRGGLSSFLGVEFSGNGRNGDQGGVNKGSTIPGDGGTGASVPISIYGSFSEMKSPGQRGKGGDGGRGGVYLPSVIQRTEGKPGYSGEIAIRMWH